MPIENTPESERPTLTWFPVRYIRDIAEGKRSAVSWLSQAPEFGFDYVELHYTLVPNEEQLQRVHAELVKSGLEVSMLTCAPDFTHPDAEVRKSQIEKMKSKIDIARYLGTDAIRVTTGMRHPGVGLDEGIDWACQCLLTLAEYAEPRGVTLCLENHYKDRVWDELDFAVEVETFLQVYDRLESSPVMVNYDTSQPMVINVDGVTLLERFKDKVFNVHAGDRVRGQRPHAVIGEGDVDFDRIFAILKSVGYSRFITVEDGSSEGDEGLRKGLSFLRAKLIKHWGIPGRRAKRWQDQIQR